MEERELTLGEIIDDAMTFLDFGPEVMMLAEPDGFYCDMEPEEFELARASITYLGYRLLLMHRMKRADPPRSAGWVAMNHYRSEIYMELADALGIRGPQDDRINEVRRLYKVASRKWDEDEGYRDRIESIMQDFEEDYGLNEGSLGIVLI